MSKIRHKKRILPLTGRQVNGGHRSDDVDGMEAGAQTLVRSDQFPLLPVCEKTPNGLVAAPTDRWEAYRSTHGRVNVYRNDPDELRHLPRFRDRADKLHSIGDGIWRSTKRSAEEASAEIERNKRLHPYRGQHMARSREFWNGANNRALKASTSALRARQLRTMIEAMEAEGLNVESFMAEGGSPIQLARSLSGHSYMPPKLKSSGEPVTAQ